MADGAIQIDVVGMVESLNVSVACAVCLYEAFRQRTVAGHYELPKLDRIVCARWKKTGFADNCRPQTGSLIPTYPGRRPTCC